MKDELEIKLTLIFALAAMCLVIGIWFGKSTAIHNCYMVSENESTYVLNFNGTEHLYLKESEVIK